MARGGLGSLPVILPEAAMNIGKTLFAQFMDFLPPTTFTLIVTRYGGDRYVESAHLAEQFRIMGFAQLNYCERLRDIEVCLSGRRRSSPTWGSVRRSSTPRWLAPTLTISRCRRQPFARSTRCVGRWNCSSNESSGIFVSSGSSENAMQSQIWIPVQSMFSPPWLKRCPLV